MTSFMPPAKKPRKSLARSTAELARLRCLDVDMNENMKREREEETVAERREAEEDSGLATSNGSATSCQEEKELRKERGEMLLRLFKNEPMLANTASARKLEQNQERAVKWEKITEEVNSTFGTRLEFLTTEKVKKLLTYYKKKEDGNYENVILYNSHIIFDEEEEKRITETTDEDAEEDERKNSGEIEEEVDAQREKEKSEGEGNSNDLSLMLGQKHTAQTLIELLASIGEKRTEGNGTVPISTDRQYELKKERHNFIVQLAEFYQERMSFDNSSRSAAVNAERHNMWVRITHKANEKFAEALGPLGVEQAKKLYSNCKRRRRVKQTGQTDSVLLKQLPVAEIAAMTSPSSLPASSSRDSVSRQPEDSASPQPDIAALTNVSYHFENLLMGLDKSLEVEVLRRQLAERDAEVERLRKKVVEQAEDYRGRVKAILEIVRIATETKISKDLSSIM